MAMAASPSSPSSPCSFGHGLPQAIACSPGLDILSPFSHVSGLPCLRASSTLASLPICKDEESANFFIRGIPPVPLPDHDPQTDLDESSPGQESCSSSDGEADQDTAPGKPRERKYMNRKQIHFSTMDVPVFPNVQALAHRIRNAASLNEGIRIYNRLKEAGFDQDAYAANLLIGMFHKFDDLPTARTIFDALKYPSVVTWNCIMSAYIKSKLNKEALLLFRQMLQGGHRPNRTTFVIILGACVSPESLAEGKWIHAYVDKHRLRKDIAVCNSLITMYSRCGDLKLAVSVFENMQVRNIVSWNAAIASYCYHKNKQKALDLFSRMQQQRVQPNQRTFVGMLNVFDSPECLVDGKEIHNCILDHGFHTELFVGNALINMYRKCGSPNDALLVFEQMEVHDVISWTTIIDAYAENGHGKEALHLFQTMQEKGVKPNKLTFISALRACALLEDAQAGEAVYTLLKQFGIQADVYLENALIFMYAKCGALTMARKVFDAMLFRDTVSWTVMLHAYTSHNYASEALELFKAMQESNLDLEKTHFVSALDACGLLCLINEGKALHEDIRRRGFLSDSNVGNALMCMYGRCGALRDAIDVFENNRHRDIVSWNSMIMMFANWHCSLDAFNCYAAMQNSGAAPNKITFLGLLNACISANDCLKGKEFHRNIVEFGYDKEVYLGNALIQMYGNCDSVEDAVAVFQYIEKPDLVLWNVLIGAYCSCDNSKGALHIFRLMRESNVKPNKVTYLYVLGACANLGDQELGKMVHELIKDSSWSSDVVVGGALINMYGKFRDLNAACEVFENMDGQNVVSWTAMIDAYAKHGLHKEARMLLTSMQQNNCEPNIVTLVTMLGSCISPAALDDAMSVHAYIIDEGLETEPLLGNTLVSMYGKCHALDFACQAFHRTGQHDVVSWTALMNAFLRSQKFPEVLHIFEDMQKFVQPNQVTFICAIRACTYLKSLAVGKKIHDKVKESSHCRDIAVKQALIDMYHSCGAFGDLYLLTS